MKCSELTPDEWDTMMIFCSDCDGYLCVKAAGESCPGCEVFAEELKQLRKEWAEE